MKKLFTVTLFLMCGIVFAEGVPFSSISSFDRNTNTIHVKFVADTIDKGQEESFPQFPFDPIVGDYVQGFTGKWYIIERRTFDWQGRPARSPSRFTIYLARADEPPKVAEGACQ